MYCHGMAMLAISEALALTGDSQLVSAVRRAVEYSVRAQHPTDGGWRYYPGDTGDMSQFGWQVLSIHSAGLGGVHVPKSTVDGMHRFLHASTIPQVEAEIETAVGRIDLRARAHG